MRFQVAPQSVIIAGFSAPKGSEAENHQIAQHRTTLVQKTLVDLAVDPKVLVTLPLGPAKDEFGPTGDRRIEIRLLRDGTTPLDPSMDQAK